MGILNVDNLRGVGSGTSVTCLSNRLETTNINASGIITATSFDGPSNRLETTNINASGIITATGFVGPFENTGDFTIDDYIVHAGDTDTKLGFPSADAVDIFAGGKQVRLTSDGYLGINRTTPVAPISARRTDAGGTGTNGVTAEFANSSGYGVWFGQASASGAAWGATTSDFYWNTGGLSSQVERLRITSAGKVGIGTDDPVGGVSSGMFEIYNSAHAKNRVAITVNEAQDNAGRIDFKAGHGSFSSTNVQASVEGIITNSSGALTGDLVFHTNEGDLLTEKLRITSRGYREIRNYHYGPYAFTNDSWKSTFTIGDPGDGKHTTVKFILTIEDVNYRQGFWQGEFVIWSSNSNGAPGVSHIYKKIWDNIGSTNWSGGTVSYQMSGGAFQFKADNGHDDANGNAYIHVLDVIGDIDGSTVASITA